MRHDRPPPWLVVIASSSGGFQALTALVSRLPADLPAALLVVSHTAATSVRCLSRLLSEAGPLPAAYPEEGQALEAGRIFVAPPDRHLVVREGGLHLSSRAKEHGLRPAADVLFRSAARTFGARSLGIVLSGAGRDGAAGLAEIQNAGGLTLVQAPEDAAVATMPLSALARVRPEACVPAAELGAVLTRLLRERGPETRGAAPREVPRKPPRPHPSSLRGLRIFIAEDEYLIASEIVGMLRELGCDVAGLVPDVAGGLRWVEREQGRVDCAVLDVDLRGERVLPLALALTRWKVPFVFATGYGQDMLPGVWAGAPRLQKPYDAPSLGAALRGALRQRWRVSPEAATSFSVIHPAINLTEEALKRSRNLLMRSRALRTTSSGVLLHQSSETLRRTRECLASSTRRSRATRRMLQEGSSSNAREVDGPGGESTE